MMQKQTLVAGAKKAGFFAGFAGALAPVASHAQATGADYSAITAAVDWSSVTTGIISILALGAAVIVAFVGGKLLIGAIKGGK